MTFKWNRRYAILVITAVLIVLICIVLAIKNLLNSVLETDPCQNGYVSCDEISNLYLDCRNQMVYVPFSLNTVYKISLNKNTTTSILFPQDYIVENVCLPLNSEPTVFYFLHFNTLFVKPTHYKVGSPDQCMRCEVMAPDSSKGSIFLRFSHDTNSVYTVFLSNDTIQQISSFLEDRISAENCTLSLQFDHIYTIPIRSNGKIAIAFPNRFTIQTGMPGYDEHDFHYCVTGRISENILYVESNSDKPFVITENVLVEDSNKKIKIVVLRYLNEMSNVRTITFDYNDKY